MSSAIDTRINELIGAAPEALDTLKEIADSLNNEPNLATSLLSQITALDNKIDNINTNQTNALNAAVTDIEAALARKADLE